MASQAQYPSTSQYGASRSRLSISSQTTTVPGGPLALNGNGHRFEQSRASEDATNHVKRPGQYSISSVLHDPEAPASLLPALPSLSSNAYLPTSISSLGTTFTSAGTLPRSSASSKSVAQRRSQAPPIVVSEVRKVVRSEFDEYLNEVGPAWERWQKESRLGREGTADLRESVNGGVGLGLGGVEEQGGHSVRRVKEEELPPLDGVPQIFFDPAFNLSNPRTFDLVTERIQLTPSNSPQLGATDDPDPLDILSQGPAFEPIPGLGPLTLNDLATDQILQEKLSHYTAVIESHLVREIGLRSSSFFSALSNLQSLHQQGEDTLAKIAELQSALSKEEKGVGGSAKRGLEILRGQARRRGLEKIEESVRAVEEIWSGVEAVKEMVEHGEWVGALEVSEQIESIYHGSSTTDADDSTPGFAHSPSLDLATPSTATTPKRRARASKLNLTRVRALDGVPKKLALLRAQVAKSLESELIGILEHEMEVGVEDYRRLSTKGAWKGKGKEESASLFSPSSATSPPIARGVAAIMASPISVEDAPKEGEAGEELAEERAKERARPVVRGLVRAEGMDGAVAAWRESALRETRAMVREHLPSNETPSVDEEDQFAQLAVRSVSRASIDLNSISEKSISLAKKLRAMSHPAFLALARDTYLGLLGCIEVVDIHAHVLIELAGESRAEERQRKARQRPTNSGGDDSKPTTPQSSSSLSVPVQDDDRPSVSLSTSPETLDRPPSPSSASDDATATDISDVVHAIAELANLRFSKVIGVRTEVHAALDLFEFVEIFDASWAFVLQCEVICQRMIVGLRGVMVGQAKTFLQTFHQKRLTDSARLVENEQWVASDVKPSTQAIINLILQGAMLDPEEFLLGQRKRDKGVQSLEASTEDGPLAKQVDIEGRQYFAVSAGLTNLEVLSDYIKVVVNCPLLTTDAMSKVIEFMKSFNSRTCQVVLGAGAMRSAGLKNITAKHLALASQALSIMISLIPYIRETLRRHLNAKQAVMLTEFDKLKRDYQEHQNEIHSKLVAIMSDRLQVHCRTLEGIDWGQPSPKAGGPNAYMEGLVKENITLHKVLSRFLQSETVEFIMGQVFSALDARLKEEYGKIEVKSDGAKQRLLADAVYLRTKLGELKGLEARAPGQELEPLILAKPVPEALHPPAPPRRTSSTTALFSASSSPALVPSPASPASDETSTRTSFDLSAVPSPSVTPAPATSATEQPLPAIPAESPPLPSPEPAAPVVEAPLPPPPTLFVAPPADVPLAAPGPPKKKTLAERLAEMAKRRSPAPAVATPTSVPPPVPTPIATPTPAPVVAPVPEAISAPPPVETPTSQPEEVKEDQQAEPTTAKEEEVVEDSKAEEVEVVPKPSSVVDEPKTVDGEDQDEKAIDEAVDGPTVEEEPREEEPSVEDAVDAVLDGDETVEDDSPVEEQDQAIAEALDEVDLPVGVSLGDEEPSTTEREVETTSGEDATETKPIEEPSAVEEESSPKPSAVEESAVVEEEKEPELEEEDVEEEESSFL